MSVGTAHERELMVFAGELECRVRGGALRLSGHTQAGARCELLFADARGEPPPERLRDLRVLERIGEGAAPRYRLESAGARVWTLDARAVQAHRECARAFFDPLPVTPVPWRRRIGWGVLLALLRRPALAAWLARRGGA